MRSRLFNRPVLLVLSVASLLCIALLGGCPAPQTPEQPPAEEEEDTTPPEETPPDINPPRPIEPPPMDEDEDDGSAGDGDGQVSQGRSTYIGLYQPFENIALRLDDVVNVEFYLSVAPGTTIGEIELILARDDNADGVADGSPIYARVISAFEGENTVPFEAEEASSFLTNNFGRFLLGIRVAISGAAPLIGYARGRVAIDAEAPTAAWVSPAGDELVGRDATWSIQLDTSDNGPHTVTVMLENVSSGATLVFATEEFPPGSATRTLTTSLTGMPHGTYYYYVTVSDGTDPPLAFYAPTTGDGGAGQYRLAITNRLVGSFDLNQLDPDSTAYDNDGVLSKGAILQGFNFNDLAGSSMTGVPDLDADGNDELVVVSRFGKPRVASAQGVGWGEAYLVLGEAERLREPKRLNAVGTLGASGIPGLVFTGIRCPRATSWSEGISDVTYVPDMDGDDLADLVFSFPRVESISLANDVWQHPEMQGYVTAMGAFEYDPFDDVVDTVDVEDPANPGTYLFRRSDVEIQLDGATWLKNRTQFTRGGIVIVSSQNALIQSRSRLNFKGDRIIDLHETGQMFSDRRRDTHVPLIEDDITLDLVEVCDGSDTDYEDIIIFWDAILEHQGPVGFSNRFTNEDFADPLNPPLANMWRAGWSLPSIGSDYLTELADTTENRCEANCVVANEWLPYTPCMFTTNTGSLYFLQDGDYVGATPDDPDTDFGFAIWTGFSGRDTPEVSPWSETVGARVLGQRVDNKFGTAVSADGTWLYISAPQRTAREVDVPDMGVDPADPQESRQLSGVVYQYRTHSPSFVGGPTRAQLWIEPGTRRILDPENPPEDPDDPQDEDYIDVEATWPYPDIHRPEHEDYAMPVPHTYIVEDVGSQRGTDLVWEEEWVRIFGSLASYDETARTITYPLTAPGCAANQQVQTSVQGGVRSEAECTSPRWPATYIGGSRGHIDRTSQIVGPHEGAGISFVRALGDVDADGVRDFAVGSANVRSDFADPTSDVVGAIFIVFGRATGLEGDYLLEKLALETSDVDRLAGVVVKGSSPNEKLARVLDNAGNFNGDVFDDVVIGNEVGSGGVGEAIVLLGSAYLQSPGGGWTVDEAVAAKVAVRFIGENTGDLVGANVAGAGDVDGDGLDDILIAAPNAEGGKGAVYLVYGSGDYSGGQEINLSDVGTVSVQGAKFIGRAAGDALGGGVLTYGDGDPDNPNGAVYLNPDSLPVDVFSDGIVSIGDLDGDGRGDIAIGAMLADPLGRRDAGEVYIIYGRGN